LDSTTPPIAWTSIADWKGVSSLECISVGYLIAEDTISKTIVPHLAYPDDLEQCQGNEIIVIPQGAIISVERLSSVYETRASRREA
jgi:hypothetical protein